MNVKELIRQLKKFDGDLEILTQGCDCDGDVGKVEYLEYNERLDGTGEQRKYVYLRRSDR